MTALNIKAGDVVEIRGGRTAAAVALPAYEEDRYQFVVRLDGVVRRNVDVEIDDFVELVAASVKEARRVVLAPVDMRLQVDDRVTEDFRRALRDKPLLQENYVFVVVCGEVVPLNVIRTTPEGVVHVTDATFIEVIPQPRSSGHTRE